MKPLDILYEMEVAESCRKHPDTEEHLTRSIIRKRKQSKANDVTKAIIRFLTLSGHQAERINTMGRMIDTRKTYKNVLGQTCQIGSMKYIPTTGTKGSADISCTILGRSVKVEVKVGKDRMSDAQRAYQAAIEMAGGVYWTATSFDDFYEKYLEFVKNT